MSEKLNRVIQFLAKCRTLDGTEEYRLAKALREQANMAYLKYTAYLRAGFEPSAALWLVHAELSSMPMQEDVFPPDGLLE